MPRVSYLKGNCFKVQKTRVSLVLKNNTNHRPHTSVRLVHKDRYSNIPKFKRIVKQILSNAVHVNRYRFRPNLIDRSYFNRYILDKSNISFKRTINLLFCRIPSYHAEEDHYLSQLDQFNTTRFPSLDFNRAYFSLCIIHIRHNRLNTFACVTDHQTGNVVYKQSCGTLGYRGIKKPTKFARRVVSKSIAYYIYYRYNFADIVLFIPFARFLKYYIASFRKRIPRNEIRYLTLVKHRPHGICTRKKKQRRV
jgi:hypothetical protein